MISATEDELSQSFTWTDDSYSLAEFTTEFPLPQVVKVVRGHDGGTASTTIGYGEVLTLHALREARVLLSEDKNGNSLSVSLDFPGEFQILPQAKDCSLSSCRVTDMPSFYQTVKYLEVCQAHYGTGDDVDSTAVGELLEILAIAKPNKPEKCKVHVRNVENDEKSTLTSTCSAQFRPLLDWKKYKAPELKTHQFGLPVRVRFVGEGFGEDAEYQSLIYKTPDINVFTEADDVIIVATTVSSEPDFKFCFEIPKDIEIKVAVAEGFSNGARHYTDIVNTLDGRFDVTKFIATHPQAPLKRRDVIRQYDYEAIRRFIVDKSISLQKFDENEDFDVPAPPPRHVRMEKSKSIDVAPSPPPLPERPESKRKNSAPSIETDFQKTKPPVARRPRSVSQHHGSGFTDNVRILFDQSQIVANDVVKLPKSVPAKPESIPSRPDNDSSEHPSTNPRKDVKKPPPVAPRCNGSTSVDVSLVTTSRPIDPLQAELKHRVQRKQQIEAENIPEQDKTPKKKEMASKPKHVPLPSDASSTSDTATVMSSSPSESDKKGDSSEVKSPVLPPRDGRPKLVDAVNKDEVRTIAQKNLDSVTDDDEPAPKLPAKSPKIAKKNLAAYSHYVEPVRPNVPVGSARPPLDLRQLPHSPSIKRNQFGRNRPGTLPKDYKIGGKPYTPDYKETEDDGIYDLPVLPVAPQVSSSPLRNSPLPPTPTDTSNSSTPHPGRNEDPYELIAKVPLDLSGLSVSQVSDILRNLNMGQHADRFEDEMIDGKFLMELTESDLELFEIEGFYRKKLLRFINGWRPQIGARRQTTI